MNRRTYLGTTATIACSLGAGCVAAQDDGGALVTEEEQSPTPTETPTATAERPTTTARTVSTAPPTTSDEASPTMTREPTPTATATRTPEPPTAREAYPDYEWAKVDAAAPVAAARIRLRDTSGFLQSRRVEFQPLVTAVEPGTDLTVENADSEDHTFTVPRLRIDRQLAAGASVTVSFTRPGSFDYVCAVHSPGEVGRIVVTEDLPTSTPTRPPMGNTSGNA
ncbi:cupredoxin domain-containing protein [Salinirubellus sp. GCM10025818]|uniref:cupredoxin domain-containing protein n=1 Tax=Salinirubellus TaxID=2162630 RepID=UPI0030CD767D